MWDSLPTVVRWAVYIVATVIVVAAALWALIAAGWVAGTLFGGIAKLFRGDPAQPSRGERREAKRRRALGYD